MKNEKSFLPVRLETDQKEALERICSELGLTTSAVTRMLIEAFQVHYARTHGKIELPLRLKQG